MNNSNIFKMNHIPSFDVSSNFNLIIADSIEIYVISLRVRATPTRLETRTQNFIILVGENCSYRVKYHALGPTPICKNVRSGQ